MPSGQCRPTGAGKHLSDTTARCRYERRTYRALNSSRVPAQERLPGRVCSAIRTGTLGSSLFSGERLQPLAARRVVDVMPSLTAAGLTAMVQPGRSRVHEKSAGSLRRNADKRTIHTRDARHLHCRTAFPGETDEEDLKGAGGIVMALNAADLRRELFNLRTAGRR